MAYLSIPDDQIVQHVVVAGGTGSGKTTLVKQLVDQAIDRGWYCVFLDQKREWLQRYYVEGRDYLVDFRDERCCRWMMGEEAEDEPHATAIAYGAFPDALSETANSTYWKTKVRQLLAYLISHYRPTTSQLARWMRNEAEIDARVVGTPHAVTLNRGSMEQRLGALNTLNQLAPVLTWMPDEESRRQFTIRKWAQKRDGHVFLPSLPVTKEAAASFQSLMLNCLLLSVQTWKGNALFVLDEIADLPRQHQLESALSLQRSSGVPIILTFQSYSALEEKYGIPGAKSMTANPYTRIIMRANTKTNAEQYLNLIGSDAQVQRIRESKHPLRFFNRQYTTEVVMDPPVIPGEVLSLERGECFFSRGEDIYRFRIKHRADRMIAPELMKRIIPIQFPESDMDQGTTVQEEKPEQYKRKKRTREKSQGTLFAIPKEKESKQHANQD